MSCGFDLALDERLVHFIPFIRSPKSDTEQEYESEEDGSNPYPLEGKFIDEADRERCGLLFYESRGLI